MAGRPRKRETGVQTGSGLDEDGGWMPQFPGQRPPFPRGNDLHLSHGAYASPLRLGERADEIAEQVRPLLPTPGPAFETTTHSYGLVLTRVEKAVAALERAEGTDDHAEAEKLTRLQKDLRLWLQTALRYAEALAITPASQGRLYRDAALGKTAAAQAALREHLDANYGDAV
jgi:hypothetical protein